MRDTRLESGSETYTETVLVYSAMKEATKANVPGYKAGVENLKRDFILKKVDAVLLRNNYE